MHESSTYSKFVKLYDNTVLDRQNKTHCLQWRIHGRVPGVPDTHLIFLEIQWNPALRTLKLTRLIRTPVNTDNGHFSVSRVTNFYTLSTPIYGHYFSVHCEFSLSRLFANLKTLDRGQIMSEFEELKPFYYKEKLNSVTSGV